MIQFDGGALKSRALLVRVFLVAALSLPLVGVVDWFAHPILDDAVISISYGQSFWEGLGFRLTSRSPVVEGFTSPLWAVWAGLGAHLGFPFYGFAKWSGVAFLGLGLPILAGSRSIWRMGARTLAIAFAVAFPSLPFWAGSGMEVGLQVFVLAVVVRMFEARKVPSVWVGAFLAGLIAVRPEYLVTGAGLLLVFCVEGMLTEKWTFFLKPCLAWAAVMGAFFVWRWTTFADWLPNTWYAKRTWDFDGTKYVFSFLQMHRFLLSASVLSLLGLCFTERRRQVMTLVVIVSTALFFGYLARGDWMREWRFLVVTIPFLLFSIGLLIETAWTDRKRVLMGLGAVAFGTLVYGAYQQRFRHETLKNAPEFSATFVEANARRMKGQLDALGLRHPQLGLPDVGALAAVFRDADIVDVAGLADYSMAHANSHRAMEDYLVSEGPPVVIDAHGPSGHVAFPSLRRFYPNWRRGVALMSGLTATEDPRCPGEKTRLLSKGGAYAVERLQTLWTESDPVRLMYFWRCVESYLDERQEPVRSEAMRIASLARVEADRIEISQPERALRYVSLQAVLGDSPQARRRAEQLRNGLFSK